MGSAGACILWPARGDDKSGEPRTAFRTDQPAPERIPTINNIEVASEVLDQLFHIEVSEVTAPDRKAVLTMSADGPSARHILAKGHRVPPLSSISSTAEN
jgi:hypothetical protein